MCPKKAKKLTVFQEIDRLAMLWLLYRSGVLQKLLEDVKGVAKSSDKNTINTASTVGKQGKEKGNLKERLEKKSGRN